MGQSVQSLSRRAPKTRCGACAIRDRAICAYCGPDELEKLDAIKSYRAFKKGAEIVKAGEETPFVASIVNGVVARSRTLVDGRRQMVALQFPSDFIGGPSRRIATCDAVAASEVLLCQFDRAAFERLLQETPELKDRLLELTFNDLDTAQEWLTLLGQKTAREKVATFLLMITRRSPPPQPGDRVTADLPITRSEIGEYLGLTIETVSRQLSKLKSSGLIDFESTRRFSVPDVAALAAEAGDPTTP